MLVLLSFEVFDDVAFYWFLQAILGMFVLCPALWKGIGFLNFFGKSGEKAEECPCDECLAKRSSTGKNEFRDSLKRPSVVAYCVLVVMFVLLIVQAPQFQKEEMANFDPYDILGIENGCEPQLIKKAYRDMSRVWHPDKNREDPDAAKKFMLITKAYQTLTDEATRENYEKYGNPDGYQGTSVTIGLPSFMTDKDSEPFVMALYVAVIATLVFSVVFWWKFRQHFHHRGVHVETMEIYWRFLQSKSSLLEVFCAADEFKYFALNKSADVYKKCGDEMELKPLLLKVDYVERAHIIVHRHMRRMNIPKELRNDADFMLETGHKLLDCLLEVAFVRGMFVQAQAAMIFAQCLAQAMYPTDLPLRQLPGVGPEAAAWIRENKKIKSMIELKSRTQAELSSILAECPDFPKDRIRAFHTALAYVPTVEIRFSCETPGEKEIVLGDIVEVTVQLRRIDDYVNSDSSDSAIVEDDEDKEEERTVDDPFVNTSRRRTTGGTARGVHAPDCSMVKHERWVLFLLDRKGLRIIAMKRIATLGMEARVKMQSRVQRPGTHEWRLVAMCDSYLGADVVRDLTVEVVERDTAATTATSGPNEHVHSDSDESDDEMPEFGPWYFMFASTWVELLLMILLFYVLWIWLGNTRVGRKYVLPASEYIWKFVDPAYKIVSNYVAFLWGFIEPSYDATWEFVCGWMPSFCENEWSAEHDEM
eukprot:409557_1